MIPRTLHLYIAQGSSNDLITSHSNQQLDASYTYIGSSIPYYQWLHYND